MASAEVSTKPPAAPTRKVVAQPKDMVAQSLKQDLNATLNKNSVECDESAKNGANIKKLERSESVSHMKDTEGGIVIPRFSVSTGSSIISKRNFGLFRDMAAAGCPQNFLVKADTTRPRPETLATRRGSAPSVNPLTDSDSRSRDATPEPSEPIANPKRKVLKRQNTVPAHKPEFGEGGLGDKSASRWQWPGRVQPHIRQDENNFEVEIDIRPFTPKEIWAKVMGTELIIHAHKDGPGEGYFGTQQQLFRTYQLPLNVDPRTVKFRMVKNYKLVIMAVKIPQLKMMVCSYIDALLKKGEDVDDSKITKAIYGCIDQVPMTEPTGIAGAKENSPTDSNDNSLNVDTEAASSGFHSDLSSPTDEASTPTDLLSVTSDDVDSHGETKMNRSIC